jgi:hypothetical protein
MQHFNLIMPGLPVKKYPFSEATIYLITDKKGASLDDIKTPEHNGGSC